MNSQQAAKAADALLAAWKKAGGTIATLPDDATPATVDDGYAVQDALIERLGKKTVGWKLAHSAPAALQKNGLTNPPLGRVLEGTLAEDGSSLPRKNFRLPRLEAEIAFKLAKDMLARAEPYTKADAAAAVASAHLAIEVADSRYTDMTKASLPLFVADNSASGALVIGKQLSDWKDRDFQDGAVKLTLDGKLLGDAAPRDGRCDPLHVLALAANELGRRGLGFKAGDIVTTGSHVPPQAVQGSGTIVADFGPLGTASITLAP